MTNKKVWIAITVGVWLVALASWRGRCEQAWLAWGIDIPACPDGEVRQSAVLDASGLRRGAPGRVALRAIAHYTTSDADGDERATVPDASSIALSLTAAKGPPRPLEVAGWDHRDGGAGAELTLPDVPDGNYQLRASYRTPLGAGEVTAPLALYTPARIHVITDRPLYQPGTTVRFRAVVLRARDLAPLDHRPGTWVVRDPSNEVVLEEAAPAGEWGVVAGSFPPDRAAPSGDWKVAWRSADATDEVSFRVAPFTLPRFRVDATADRPFYRPGDAPRIHGAVIYSSGAPVAGAALDIAWSVAGDWPPPAAADDDARLRARGHRRDRGPAVDPAADRAGGWCRTCGCGSARCSPGRQSGSPRS
ncbi:MAG TPA: MG2 domain-containing protein [Kofleriaceae bacterium]